MPRCAMYGIFTYIWVICGVNVGKYSIHGASGIGKQPTMAISGTRVPRMPGLLNWGGPHPTTVSRNDAWSTLHMGWSNHIPDQIGRSM
jgi:hypothetical protein